jgi:hypothetical protein
MGYLNVDDMLDQMTPEQWQEWQAKDAIDPIGHRGTHEVMAIFGAMVANALGAKNITPYFLLWWRNENRQQTASHDVAAMALQMIGAKRNG